MFTVLQKQQFTSVAVWNQEESGEKESKRAGKTANTIRYWLERHLAAGGRWE